MDVALRQIDVVVVSLSNNLNFGFKALVAQVELICVFFGFLRREHEN